MQSRIVSLQCWDLTVCVNKLVEQAVDQSSGKDLLHIVSSDIHNWTMRQQGANGPPCPLGPADSIGSDIYLQVILILGSSVTLEKLSHGFVLLLYVNLTLSNSNS